MYFFPPRDENSKPRYVLYSDRITIGAHYCRTIQRKRRAYPAHDPDPALPLRLANTEIRERKKKRGKKGKKKEKKKDVCLPHGRVAIVQGNPNSKNGI